ncbi:hypothetical protein RUM43_010386 [Polyplax serrata]|uniref:FIST C-domain domain-containing protein n=1 Tax=Polyplax serrata TaxID=468196 RepID=A0AAN8P0A9_POLSC
MTETTYTDKTVDRIRNIHYDGNFLNYLSSAYEVLRKIFSYLSMEDLENASKAFEGWVTVVETTKKERTQIESFVVYPKYPIQPFEVWSEASFCFTFCLSPNKEIQQKLKRHLTDDAQLLVVESRAGVIGTYSDLSRLIQRTNSNSAGSPSSMDCPAVHMRIPTIPGAGIKMFTWRRNSTFQQFRDSFSLPQNQIIKCLLILMTVQDGNTESVDQKDDFILYLKSIQSEDFAVGGCLVDLFVDEGETDSSNIITKYIVFYGDKVEAASTVLKGNTITKKGIDSAIEELKEMSLKSDKGLLFVFRCCSRNELSRHSKGRKCISDWEGNSIVKHFCTTPVIGCFGYGEFGRKFPDQSKSKPQSKRAKECNFWEYSYSTSIVYVGFKN